MATVPALREVCHSERTALEGTAAYCTPRNKVNLCFAEGLNNKIRMIQRRAYGYPDEKDCRLKILTTFLSQKRAENIHTNMR